MKENYVFRRLLNLPIVYRLFEDFIAKKNGRQIFYDRYVGDVEGKYILDLGCGTGDILDCITGEKRYIGIDNNKKYIEQNKERFKGRKTANFYYADLNTYAEKCEGKFDMILLIGVIHHISDDEVEKAMISIKNLLNKGGIFISHDPCYTKDMNPIARILCKLDRGQYVRYKEQYIEMMNKFWDDIWYEIQTDTLRFLPYSVIIFKNKDGIGGD